MSKFDDDIRRIAVLVNDFGDGRDGDAWDRLHVVLEAAGKVDNIHRAIQLMKHSSELRYCKVIRLLEALPDKEGEERKNG